MAPQPEDHEITIAGVIFKTPLTDGDEGMVLHAVFQLVPPAEVDPPTGRGVGLHVLLELNPVEGAVLELLPGLGVRALAVSHSDFVVFLGKSNFEF